MAVVAIVFALCALASSLAALPHLHASSSSSHSSSHDDAPTTPSTSAIPTGTVSLISATNPDLIARHCSYELFAHNGRNTADGDFDFLIVPAVNKAPGAFSFQSLNFPDFYITLVNDTGVESGRLGIGALHDVNDASFLVVPGVSNPALFSLVSLSRGPFHNAYVAINNKLEGACSKEYSSPSSDIVLAAAPFSTEAATWSIINAPMPPPQNHTLILNTTQILHKTDPLYLGCHSDSGFTHQARGLYSQMVFGEVFEYGLWPNKVQSSSISTATIELDNSTKFNNFPSLHVAFQGDGYAGVANRGLGNEGLVFQGGKDYEGYIFATSKVETTVIVRLENYVDNQVLAEATLTVPAGNWTQIPFSFTTSDSTNCEGIDPTAYPEIDCRGSAGGAHPCIRCGGQITVVLGGSGGEVWINYVFVQPGQWGRFAGLPVQLEAVTWLQAMGVTSIRQGGSFTRDEYYFWKNWRGAAWDRPSLGSIWHHALISGWGPFEMIDLCNSAGIEPIITTSSEEAPSDLGDLVEYCYGNYSTTWGRQRFADGHPEPYLVKVFEIGNEEYPPNWVDQVAAMEERAAELGLPHTITYMFPRNSGPNKDDAARAEALGLGDHLVADIHIGAGGAVPEAQELFASNPSYHQGAVNCETNAGTHNFRRALQEAQDLNQFFNVYEPRMKARTASFCMERSGHFDAFDQGLIFFLPNMTWAQPPFYVHQMIKDTWHDQIIASSTVPATNNTRVSASLSDDGEFLVIRYVNDGGPDVVTLQINGMQVQPTARVWQLQSDDLTADNTPAEPTKISSVYSTVDISSGVLRLPAQSYTVILLQSA